MTVTIENFDNAERIGRILARGMQNRWNRGAWLRPKIKDARRVTKACLQRSRDTEHMPCGYQDAAGDALSSASSYEYELKAAFIIARYGALPRGLSEVFADTFTSSNARSCPTT